MCVGEGRVDIRQVKRFTISNQWDDESERQYIWMISMTSDVTRWWVFHTTLERSFEQVTFAINNVVPKTRIWMLLENWDGGVCGCGCDGGGCSYEE